MDTASSGWPGAPVPVNRSEAVIEAFWDETFAADRRWTPSPHGADGPYWRSHHGHGNELCWSGTGSIELTRSYELPVRGYSRLSLAIRLDADTRVSLYATVDGSEYAVVEDQPGCNRKHEYDGPLTGDRLERVRITLRAVTDGERDAWFRWLLVGRDAPAWEPPPDPFAGMIAAEPLAACEPGLGLLLDADDLERLRQIRATPPYASAVAEDADRAAVQSELDPEDTLRQHWLYSPDRFGRDADEFVDMANDGMSLAIEGLLTGNAGYLRQAARYAVTMAHMQHWSEGFTDRFPDSAWRHNAFAPNVATIKASLLLDFAWHALTPDGRELVRRAILTKGLPYIEPYVARGHRLVSMNQGVRFMKGAILGTLATAADPRGESTRAAVADYIDRLSAGMMDQTRADGTYVEGNTYGLGTLGSAFASYHAAARCLGVPARELVFERALDCLRFSRDIDQTITPLGAAFAAGVLGDEGFRDQCLPSSALADVFGQRNWAEFGLLGLDAIWVTAERTEALPPPRQAMSAYRDGGWVFLRNTDPRQPEVTLESGLWDPRGHTWKRKNALAVSGWGGPLLLHRHHVAYLDSRYEHTARTAAYNTLTPDGGRRPADAAGGTPARRRTIMSRRLFPIRHSEGEAILVRMFDPRRHPLADWTIDGADSGELRETFHSIQCTWPGGRPLAMAMRREVDIDVDGYDLLVLCVQSMRSTAITVRATVDGSPRVIVDRAPGIDAGQELEGRIGGRHISALEIELDDPGELPGVADLFWLGVTDSAARDARRARVLPYPDDWHDLLLPDAVEPAAAEPQLGLFFDTADLERLRARVRGPTWGPVYDRLRDVARSFRGSEPWRGIGQTINNFPVRNGHRGDGLNTPHHWIDIAAMRICAFVGLLDGDRELMRIALHHALAAAHCDVWTPGFMSGMPGSSWETRCFSEYRVAINCVFAWDWGGSLLTEAGKELLAQAVSIKAMPWIQQTLMRHPYVRGNNQGIFFAFGGIVLSVALARHWPYGGDFLEPFREALDQTVRAYYAADGGTYEGIGYATGSLQQALAGYAIYARHRGVPLAEIVPDVAVRSVDYITAMLSTEPPVGAVIKHSDGGRAGVCVASGSLGLLCRLSGDPAVPALLAGVKEELPRANYAPEHELNIIYGPDELPAPAARPPVFNNLAVTGLLCSNRPTPDGPVRVQVIGGPAGAGHGHDDRGSFVLEAFGDELAVDRGQMPYVDPRSATIKHARYHNLAVPHAADGTPLRQLNPCPVATVPEGEGDERRLHCRVDLNGVWPEPVTGAERLLDSDDPRRLAVTERLLLDAPLPVGFCLHSRYPWERCGRGWVTAGPHGRLTVTTRWQPQVEEGGEDFVMGTKEPAYRLLLLTEAAVEHTLVTDLEVEPCA